MAQQIQWNVQFLGPIWTKKWHQTNWRVALRRGRTGIKVKRVCGFTSTPERNYRMEQSHCIDL